MHQARCKHRGAALQDSTTAVLQTQFLTNNICYICCIVTTRSINTLHNVCSCKVFCSAWPVIEANHASSVAGGMFCLGLCKRLLYYSKSTTHLCQQTLTLCQGIHSHTVINKEAGLLSNSYQVEVEQGWSASWTLTLTTGSEPSGGNP